MPAMLEQIRRNHRLGTLVLWLCAALWLVAMLAGVQVRGALAAAAHQDTAQPSPHDVCMAEVERDADTERDADAVHALHAALALADVPAQAPQGHSGHQDPDCLLCMALSPPAVVVVPLYRPPVPQQGLDWLAPAHFPPSQQATAPLPARGPPAPFHA